MDDEPCGATYEIDSAMIIEKGFTRAMEGFTLICSRPLDHTPPELHSDGVTDWIGDGE